MKNLLALTLTIWLSVFIAATAQANNVTLDPSISGQTTLTITCDYPIEREDGTSLAINEIARVQFYVEKDGAFAQAGQNTTACRQVYDMSAIPDGVYVYSVTAIDTEGRESAQSIEVVTALVKRLALPRSPAGVNGAVS